MKLTKIALACGLVSTLALGTVGTAQAQISDNVIRIGIITDMSSVYADIDGMGGVEAIKMAVADAGGAINGKKIEVVYADHQNKADVAAAKAREWFDTQGLDMLLGGTNSGTALAMAKVAAEKKKPFIAIGPGSSALTNEQCSPYTVHYAYDTVALAKGTGGAVVKAGGKSWFFLTADYAFGTALQNDTTAVVKAAGGTVVGSVRAPLNASDFSSFLLQAQSSKAQVLGLANAGGDTINAIKAANEFGVTKTMKLAGLLVFINDIHSLGLKTTQGMYLTDSWYWNKDAEARTWSRRFFEKMKRMPSSIQAADYSATANYLAAVKAAGTDDGTKSLAQLRKSKINDMYAKGGYIRDDGRMVHDMYLMQVKSPDKSTEPWDYYNVVETIKGDVAFTTKAESKCALWK
ncbi:ABC transporter substrate-binding protein [Candidatus Aalborgicola defluviihabitans]|jgi:branched-chain amino acid transport system substrate-binding protein|uniref:ABC transporter substrate-binding protein n=1 Tax=Candidatus Aalborgicola defluviihabitans TaxID=3386187 RepID=UPI001D78086E|nr:ABC transporter substrate-binding protein [Burkholderiales bacterium]MBK6570521.1 ABC transporter substrate-binding protein [Burkholderiales bacterium]MBK7279519.1 ABC transporter substrate-binding protein [Burkholderiales bacterium]MBK7312786.1 ABC transporter substrate-binding protein [Burkholderiales bacterium]MBL0243602.1 ABC transporter substrate-binding protein [Rhodoferax sp.]